jgi:penicillin-binding protein 2
VANSKGTAAPAFAGFPLAQFPIAGKTGTAQVPPKQDTALFAAFGPTEDPRYAVSVVMEESGFGAAAAAPVARRIFDQILALPLTPITRVQAHD